MKCKCCCDRCNTFRLDCGCCRCVPQRMCATREDDSEYTDDAIADYSDALFDEDGYQVAYRFEIPLPEGEDTYFTEIDLFVGLIELGEYECTKADDAPDYCCRWHVVSEFLGIDEYYLVHGYGGLDCGKKFLLELGDITIRPHIQGEVRLVGVDYSNCKRPYCGTCRCVCQTICVTETIAGVEQEPTLIEWDEDNYRWGDEYTGVALIEGDDGQCLLRMAGFADVDFACDDDTATVFTDEYDPTTYTTVSCWKCQCGGEIEVETVQTPCCPNAVPKTLTVTLTGGTEGEDCCEEIPSSFKAVYAGFTGDAETGIGQHEWTATQYLCVEPFGPAFLTFGIFCTKVSGLPPYWSAYTLSNPSEQAISVSCEPFLLSFDLDLNNTCARTFVVTE